MLLFERVLERNVAANTKLQIAAQHLDVYKLTAKAIYAELREGRSLPAMGDGRLTVC